MCASRVQELADNVTAGKQLFDERKPGWRKEVIWTTLDISDPNHCMCAQLYGSYDRGKLTLGFASKHHDQGDGEARSFGLHAVNEADYPLLTRLWLEGEQVFGEPLFPETPVAHEKAALAHA